MVRVMVRNKCSVVCDVNDPLGIPNFQREEAVGGGWLDDEWGVEGKIQSTPYNAQPNTKRVHASIKKNITPVLLLKSVKLNIPG